MRGHEKRIWLINLAAAAGMQCCFKGDFTIIQDTSFNTNYIIAPNLTSETVVWENFVVCQSPPGTNTARSHAPPTVVIGRCRHRSQHRKKSTPLDFYVTSQKTSFSRPCFYVDPQAKALIFLALVTRRKKELVANKLPYFSFSVFKMSFMIVLFSNFES